MLDETIEKYINYINLIVICFAIIIMYKKNYGNNYGYGNNNGYNGYQKKKYYGGYQKKKYYGGYKKKYNKWNNAVATTIRGGGMPDELFTKLKYSETVQMLAASSNTANYQFQSSLRDPNKTGVGHQPRYYDQIAGVLFASYQVLGMKAKIKFVNINTSPVKWAVAWTDAPTVTESPDGFSEFKYSCQGLLGITGGTDVGSCQTYMSAKKIQGAKSVLDDDNQIANYNADPADMFYLNLNAFSVNGASVNVYADVEITYYCRFQDQMQPGASLDKAKLFKDNTNKNKENKEIEDMKLKQYALEKELEMYKKLYDKKEDKTEIEKDFIALKIN